MDDSGNIKRFEEEKEALEKGFRHKLTENQAGSLEQLPMEERLPELVFMKFHEQVLKGRKLDTLEKIKFKSAIRFACKYLKT